MDAGLKGIGVSIDGPEAVHDIQRDRVGSWKAGMAAIDAAKAAGLVVTSNTQINQLTLPHLRETANELRLLVHTWRVQVTVLMGARSARMAFQPATSQDG